MEMPRLSFADIFWATLALFGALSMLGFEALCMRVFAGKW